MAIRNRWLCVDLLISKPSPGWLHSLQKIFLCLIHPHITNNIVRDTTDTQYAKETISAKGIFKTVVLKCNMTNSKERTC